MNWLGYTYYTPLFLPSPQAVISELKYWTFCMPLDWTIYLVIILFFLYLLIVDPNEAPGYFKVIKTPMDFSTIKINLEVSPSDSTFGIIITVCAWPT